MEWFSMDKYEKVIELARRRGFLWPSFEIYGGTAGFWDFGPLGAMMKRRIEDAWRDIFVVQEGNYEIEAPTIGVEEIFIASGHVKGFVDPLTECQKCGEVYRADHVIEGAGVKLPATFTVEVLTDLIKKYEVRCPECSGNLGDVYQYNLMFKTTIGPGGKRVAYLRPETAQGMFVDFPRLLKFYRDKLPFGATQVGKSYRNEISPRQGIIRLREFTQTELEYFIDPRDKRHPNFSKVANITATLYSEKDQIAGAEPKKMSFGEAVKQGIIAHEMLAYQVALTYLFLRRVGISEERLRFRQHKSTERAHYASDCWDAEIYTERFGWVEAVGIADRTNYDLTNHQKLSGVDMSVFVPYDKPKLVKRLVVKPDMSQIGPIYKDKADKIAAALKSLTEEELNRDKITVSIDGEQIEVDKKMIKYETITEEIRGEYIIPHVIEPSFGIDRTFYGVLESCYKEVEVEGAEEGEEKTRIVLSLPPEIAPIQVAVLPLISRKELMDKAQQIFRELRSKRIMAEYDDSGTIGRRYRRNDEIGTPFALTVDFDTLKDNTVTIRDRDTMKQIRIPVEGIADTIRKLIYGEIKFESLGKPLN
jgi:glycyl-tRNA synthetase